MTLNAQCDLGKSTQSRFEKAAARDNFCAYDRCESILAVGPSGCHWQQWPTTGRSWQSSW